MHMGQYPIVLRRIVHPLGGCLVDPFVDLVAFIFALKLSMASYMKLKLFLLVPYTNSHVSQLKLMQKL